MNEDYTKLKDFAQKRLNDSCADDDNNNIRYWVGYIDGLIALYKAYRQEIDWSEANEMKCDNCLHEKICYMREICNDIEEQIKEFGCKDFIDCADVREVKDGWEWKPCCKGEGDVTE